jgi:hypothetical protein
MRAEMREPIMDLDSESQCDTGDAATVKTTSNTALTIAQLKANGIDLPLEGLAYDHEKAARCVRAPGAK